MTEDDVVRIVRDWLQDIVEQAANGNVAEFARLTHIKQSDLSNVLNSKAGRRVTWRMIARMSDTPDLPHISILMALLAKRLATASIDAIAELGLESERDALREQISAARQRREQQQASLPVIAERHQLAPPRGRKPKGH